MVRWGMVLYASAWGFAVLLFVIWAFFNFLGW